MQEGNVNRAGHLDNTPEKLKASLPANVTQAE